jgi:2-dehydro-3-deoxyphosphooctonate aldolase (KDO 8-P synthase)
MKLFGDEISTSSPLFLIGGPCVIESEGIVLEVANALKMLTDKLGIRYIFKASFDKANRTSADSFRGLGMAEGLRILQRVKDEVGCLVLTDVHEDTPIDEVAAVADVLQTPAFLVRQTSFIERVAKIGRPVNVKKGQFLAPLDMENVVSKYRAFGNDQVMICDRGVSFGYNTLISDMRGLAAMRTIGCPIVFDATHSVQQPGGQGTSSGGQREMVPVVARSAVAVGISGLFMEIHPDPDRALCDGPNSWKLDRTEELLEVLIELDKVVKSRPYAEESI